MRHILHILHTLWTFLRTLRAAWGRAWRWLDAHGIIVWLIIAVALALGIIGLLAAGSN